MARILSVFLATATVAVAAWGCATHQTARQEAVTTLGQADSLEAAHEAGATGMTAYAWQDRWTAANLFEKAVAKVGNVTNRFNLATTYELTGRYEEAKAIYRDLVIRGQHTRLKSVSDRAHRTDRDYTFNVSEEAALRLADIEEADAAIAQGQALAAADVAVQASAGGAPESGHIPDAQALALDGPVDEAP